MRIIESSDREPVRDEGCHKRNPHPWRLRPRAGHPAPSGGSDLRLLSVAGRRDFRRLHHAEVVTSRGDFRRLHQLAAGMTGGSQFSSFYDLHLGKPPSDVTLQPVTRCKPGWQVTLKFRQFSIILAARM